MLRKNILYYMQADYGFTSQTDPALLPAFYDKEGGVLIMEPEDGATATGERSSAGHEGFAGANAPQKDRRRRRSDRITNVRYTPKKLWRIGT